MVAYGAKLKNARRPGWENAYLEYDVLKGLLERELCHQHQHQQQRDAAAAAAADTAAGDRSFLTVLEQEIEKVFLFTLSRQGELAEAIGAYRFPHYDITPTKTLTTFTMPLTLPPTEEADDEDDDDDDTTDTDLLLMSPIKKHSGEPVPSLPPFTRRGSGTDDHGLMVVAPTIASVRPLFRVPASTTHTATTTTTTKALTEIAMELLHLLRYICVNAVGIRKILKKYHKLWLAVQEEDGDHHRGREAAWHRADHMQQLTNAGSIAALHASLDAAWGQETLRITTSRNNSTANKTTTPSSVSTIRLQCAMEAIQVLRDYAVIVNQPFSEYLSRRAMIVTGRDREERKALWAVLRFNPDTLSPHHTPDTELVAWWWRRAAATTSASAAAAGRHQMHRRHLSSTVLNMNDVMEWVDDDFVVMDQADSWGGVNRRSMVINLASTLLYTVRSHMVIVVARQSIDRTYLLSLANQLFFNFSIHRSTTTSSLQQRITMQWTWEPMGHLDPL